MKSDVSFLLEKHTEKIRMVPYEAVNEIYCSMFLDGSGIDSFCNGLKRERRIAAVVDDITGMKVVQYLRLKGITIESIWTGCEDLPMGDTGTVMQYENALEYNKGIRSALCCSLWTARTGSVGMSQDCGSMDLRELILLSQDMLNFMKEDYRSCIWEQCGGSYRIADARNVERYHYLVGNCP